MSQEELPPELQRRVIHISNLGKQEEQAQAHTNIDELLREFWVNMPESRISSSGQGDVVTYLFESLEDVKYFGRLLDRERVPYSFHPTKDYDEVAIQNMDAVGKSLHSLVSLQGK